MTPQALECFSAFRDALITRVRDNLVDFMNRVYKLPDDQGGYDWDFYEDQKGIALMISHPDVKEAGGIKDGQAGWTEIHIGFAIHSVVDGKSTAYFLPKSEMAQSVSQTTITHWIKSVPEVLAMLVAGDPDKRNIPGNTWRERKFFYATLYFRGAGTPANTSQIPVRVGIIDEPDRIEADIGGEGGIIGLLFGRFGGNGGVARVFGTPTLDKKSRIANYVNSCKHIFECHVPCPHCDQFQTLDWGSDKHKHGFKWDKLPDIEDAAATAHYVCCHCTEKFYQADMPELLARCKWMSSTGIWFDHRDGDGEFKTLEGKYCEAPAKIGIRKTEDGSCLYSMKKRWTETARKFLEAVKYYHDNGSVTEFLKPFCNLERGIVFEHRKNKEIPVSELLKNRVKYNAPIPTEYETISGDKQKVDIQHLIAQVDFQGPFAKYTIFGIAGRDLLAIRCRRIEGRPLEVKARLWTELGEILDDEYTREDGLTLTISLSILDGRQAGDNVIKFCSESPEDRIAVYGMGTESTKLFEMDEDAHWRTVNVDGEFYSAYGVPINAHEASKRMYHKVGLAEGKPGRMIFPEDDDFNLDFMNELTADTLKKVKQTSGEFAERYAKEHDRVPNEAHDLCKYAVIGQYVVEKHGVIPKQETKKELPPPTAPSTPAGYSAFGNMFR